MFNFTNQTIINSDKLSNGVDRFKGTGTKGTDGKLFIHGVGTIKDSVVFGDCIKTAGQGSVVEKLVTTNTIGGNTSKDSVYRLSVKLKKEGDYTAQYSNPYTYNNLDFDAEMFIPKNATPTDVANAIKKAVELNNSQSADNGQLKVDVVVTPGTGGADDTVEITFSCVDEYQRFKSIELQEMISDSNTNWSGIVKHVVLIDYLTASGSTLTRGFEGRGTSKQLAKNLILPTAANTNPYTSNKDEAPQVGKLYNQYVINVAVNRPQLGGLSAMGQQVVSCSDIIVYVISDLAAAFETAVKKVANIKTIDAHT